MKLYGQFSILEYPLIKDDWTVEKKVFGTNFTGLVDLSSREGSKIAAMVLIEEVAEFSVLTAPRQREFNKLRHEVETEEKVVEPIVEDFQLEYLTMESWDVHESTLSESIAS